MNSRTQVGLLVVAMALAGCGSKSGSGSTASAPSASSGTVVAAVSQYDSGPRAGEQPIDESRVTAGEKLFTNKGCSACHAFGKRLQCPDLNGVTMRRTAQWMENQILHPDVMVKQDPISHQLFGQYSLQMPNQGLTPDEARSVIEFLKHKNHQAQEAGKGE
ncbi:MAG TPA: cytochrome c [Candidatus Sulfotelmatobacter sp.]|nr:cytochrome c [Candidatus Sulfotelmatobacter sp.]